MGRKNIKYIPLKEASEISGYSPDYIGQLIRGGKLPGKQVLQQAMWMTTEEDVRLYMEHRRVMGGGNTSGGLVEGARRVFLDRKGSIEVPRVAIRMMYVAVVFAVALFLVLFFIFSSSFEQHLNERALQVTQTGNTL